MDTLCLLGDGISYNDDAYAIISADNSFSGTRAWSEVANKLQIVSTHPKPTHSFREIAQTDAIVAANIITITLFGIFCCHCLAE